MNDASTGFFVPIQVAAHAQKDGGGAGPRSLLDSPAPANARVMPLKKGIHLYWSLPDFLTRAREVRGGDGQKELVFPAVPDVWVVVRMSPRKGNEKRTYRAWKVNSRERISTEIHPPAAGLSPALWQTVGASPGQLNPTINKPHQSVLNTPVDPVDKALNLRFQPRFTAVGLLPGGVAAKGAPGSDDQGAPLGGWAAYYPDCVNRFGFYDSLADLPPEDQESLTYMVIGWYSSKEDDPIRTASLSGNTDQFDAWLKQMRLTLGNDRGVPDKLPAYRGVFHGAIFGVSAAGGGNLTPPSPSGVSVLVANSLGQILAELLFPKHSTLQPLPLTLFEDNLDALSTLEGAMEFPYSHHASGFASVVRRGAGEAKIPLEVTPQRSPLAEQTTKPLNKPSPSAPVASQAGNTAPWYRASGPLIAVHGGRRGFLHGQDGRFDDRGRLLCRVESSILQSAHYTLVSLGINGKKPMSKELSLDPEDLLNLPTTSSVLGASKTSDLSLILGETALLDPDSAGGHLQMRNILLSVLGNEPTELFKPIEGDLPSPVARQVYDGSWQPLFLEVQCEIYPRALKDGWTLDTVDYAPTAGATPSSAPAAPRNATFRVLLARTMPRALESVLTRLMDRHADALSEEDQGRLATAIQNASELDMLSGAMSEINRKLDAATADVRAGELSIKSATLVGVFGQAVKVEGVKPLKSDASASGRFLLPPRLPCFSRVSLRLDRIKTGLSMPGPIVRGFLQPDFVDGALEIADASGAPLGQLRSDAKNPEKVVWEPPPGKPKSEPENIADANLRELVVQMLKAPSSADKESALTGLMRVIQTVRLTSALSGSAEHFSLLAGQPVAVVRASLLLETEALPDGRPCAPEGLRARLGTLFHPANGVLAWFTSKEASAVAHPPDAAVKSRALPAVRWGIGESAPLRSGIVRLDVAAYDKGITFHPGMVDVQGALGGGAKRDSDAIFAPITSPYISADDTVLLTPNQPVTVTLLVEPGSSVHVTTGILPRLRVRLPPERETRALEKLQLSFRVAPILIDPGGIQAPVADIPNLRWSWVNGKGGSQPVNRPATWAASPTGWLELQDGWLVPTPAK